MSGPMIRRSFLKHLAAPLAAPLAAQRRSSPPNVVFILSDDMGFADIEPYGAKDIRTPHLNRLAREGVKFTQCYSNGPVCTPTRAAFITGRYQQRTGLEWALVPADKNRGLHPSETGIARMLKDNGYRTALVGKWHLGMEEEFSPNHHGFDEFFGIKSGNVDMYSHKYRLGFDDLWENGELVRREGYLTELLAERAAQFVDRNASRPFFLYLAFNAVHWPFQAPGRPQDVRTVATWFDGTRQNDYVPMTEAMDAAIGRVLAALDRHGLTDNTMIVFTNDNGGERLSDNGPLFHHKATLWEGGIRVPALMRWPVGGIPRGRETQQVAITMDFTASILSATGTSPARQLDGMDLLPVLRRQRPTQERTLCWRIDRDDRKQQAVRSGRWKYVRDGSIDLLFDVEKDPGERNNLAYRNPEQLARLRGLYAEWEKEMAKSNPPFVVK